MEGQFQPEGQFQQNVNPYTPQQTGYQPQPGYQPQEAGQPVLQENNKKPMRKAYCRVEWKIFLYAVIVVASQTLYAVALPELFGDDDHSHVYDCFSGFIFVNRGQKGPCKNYAA